MKERKIRIYDKAFKLNAVKLFLEREKVQYVLIGMECFVVAVI